jgi:succinyl-CoA synthetase beta subunit
MATQDMLSLLGGKPANFLDIGGTEEQELSNDSIVMMNEDSDIRVIFLNYYSGYFPAATMAKFIQRLFQNHTLTKPLIVRIHG